MNTLEAVFTFWNKHGTKALGSLSTFFAGLQAATLVMGDILSPKQIAVVAGINAALGLWTVKRGFSNTANQAQP